MVDTSLSESEQRRQLELTYGWLPAGALDTYLREWIASGSSDTAWAAVQADTRYERWFPGNLTDDGRPRMPEDEYAKAIAGYDEVFVNVGLKPALFRDRYAELIRGDVSPYELEVDRIGPMYDRIVEGSAEIRKWYADKYGLKLTTEALLAGAIDPKLGEKILQKQISMAEIGGEAAESGYGVSERYVESLLEAGVDRERADEMFMAAETLLPTLNVLAARHKDPDDDFDLKDFVAADLYQNPLQRRRMNRLMAQEKASFTDSTASIVRSRETGGVSGLAEL